MINFPCKCGHALGVADEMAGGLIQCPRCGLLVDIPTLTDLSNLTADGTFKIGEVRTRPTDADDLAEVAVAFSPHTRNSLGQEKDLRPDAEHFKSVGEGFSEPVRVMPKYDPETGELIRALDFRDEEPTPVVPLEEVEPTPVVPLVQAVKPIPSVGYATGESRRQVTAGTLALELLMPANAVVLFFAFLGYLAVGIASTILATGSLFAQVSLQVLNLPFWFMLAHYGCVIEETGPETQDELPRPLRHFALSEDLFNPFVKVTLSLVICFLPMMLAGSPRLGIDGHIQSLLVLVLGLVGAVFFPAVLMTAVTGTTLMNLRPDRVISVIRLCGGDYILSVGVFLLSAVLTVFSVLGPLGTGINASYLMEKLVGKPYVLMPAMMICAYLTHYFCWHLGLMYRAHHDEFPWLLQRHVSNRRGPR